MSGYSIRAARLADVAAIAGVLHRSWRETYRGVMPDEVLDDPDFVPGRVRMWTDLLTDPEYANRTTALALTASDLIGVALAGPPSDDNARWHRQLYVLYVLQRYHGTGIATRLLQSVLDPDTSAALWVADPNPRAQAFYVRHGFRPDGHSTVWEKVREIRMVRRSPPLRPTG